MTEKSHSSHSENLTEFIRTWLKSWTSSGRKKPEELLLSFYTDDCFYSDPGIRDGIIGKNELSSYFKKLLLYNPEWIWEAAEIIPTQNGCILKWKATIPVKGEQITETGLDIIEIKNGLIHRNEVYFDRYKWLTRLTATS